MIRGLMTFFVLGAAMSACGGGSTAENAPAQATPADTSTEASPTTTASSATAHDAFTAEFDDLCQRGNAADKSFEDRLEAASASNDYEAAARALEDSLEVAHQYREEFDALKPPSEDRVAFNEYLSLSDALITLRTRFIHALRAHDDDELTRLGEVVDDVKKRRTILTSKLGLTECGS